MNGTHHVGVRSFGAVAALACLGYLGGCAPGEGKSVKVLLRGTGPSVRNQSFGSRAECKIDRLFVTVRGPGTKRMRIPIDDATFTAAPLTTNSFEDSGADKFVSVITIPDRVVALPAGTDRVISIMGRIALDGDCSSGFDESYPIYGEVGPVDIPAADDTLEIPVAVYNVGMAASDSDVSTGTFEGADPEYFQQVHFNIPDGSAVAGCSYNKLDVLDVTLDGKPILMTPPDLGSTIFNDLSTGDTHFENTDAVVVRGLLPARRYEIVVRPGGSNDVGCGGITGGALRLIYRTPRSEGETGIEVGYHAADCTVVSDDASLTTLLCEPDDL
ncbi:MAG: hypothetical protein IT285_12590 [Bdellovibrionales bacterium]|nr:hypothetical protein [Bdellovibrionales bacterium]